MNPYEDIDYAALAKRLKERTVVDKLTGCHIFSPAVTYAPKNERALYIKAHGRSLSVLRVVWEINHPEQRPLSQASQVRHKRTCTAKRCINPDHLRLVGEGFVQE